LQLLPAGSVVLQVENAIASVPKNSFMISAAAPPSTECPDE
jgi:hypothetical protein